MIYIGSSPPEINILLSQLVKQERDSVTITLWLMGDSVHHYHVNVIPQSAEIITLLEGQASN